MISECNASNNRIIRLSFFLSFVRFARKLVMVLHHAATSYMRGM